MNRTEIGDCRTVLPLLPEQTFQCCVTSPPYWGLRDYGHPDQIGREATPEEYVAAMVDVFREVRRVLRDDGTVWINLGDTYRNKSMVGIPWRVAFALQKDGWLLRSEVIWVKPNPMPEAVTDRPTRAHEHVFMLTKGQSYLFAADAVREPHSRDWWNESVGAEYMTARDGRNDGGKRKGNGNPLGRNIRTIWPIASEPYAEAHFATMPSALVTRCILVGSSIGSAVLDPFMGSGTVGQVAESLGRRWFGCELNGAYCELCAKRTAQTGLRFAPLNETVEANGG